MNTRPFFLLLSYTAPHWPMEAKPDDLQAFAHVPDQHRRTFLAMLKSLDDNVGRVLKALHRWSWRSGRSCSSSATTEGPRGVRDHPPMYRSPTGSIHRATVLRGGKGTVFEGGIRVPFLVQWRGKLPAGMTYDQPVSTLDLLPTVVAAADGSVPATRHVDGVDLLPFLQGEQMGPPHEILFWRFIQAHRPPRPMETRAIVRSVFPLRSGRRYRRDS